MTDNLGDVHLNESYETAGKGCAERKGRHWKEGLASCLWVKWRCRRVRFSAHKGSVRQFTRDSDNAPRVPLPEDLKRWSWIGEPGARLRVSGRQGASQAALRPSSGEHFGAGKSRRGCASGRPLALCPREPHGAVSNSKAMGLLAFSQLLSAAKYRKRSRYW